MTYVKLEDAVKAVEALKRDPPSMLDGIYNVAILQATEALRSLPTDDGVTDEMVERVARAICESEGLAPEGRCGNRAMWQTFDKAARAALEAALGPLPAPPTIE